MAKKMKIIAGLIICLVLTACSVASSIQKADQSKTGFDGAVYDGEETVIRNDIPDTEAYRIFHQVLLVLLLCCQYEIAQK